MYQTKKGTLSLLLAVIILIFNFQYAVVEKQSFENTTFPTQQYKTQTTGNVINENRISDVEILNTYHFSLGQNLLQQYRITKKDLRFFWSFLVTPFFSFSILKIISAICFMENPQIHKNKIVLQYIHDIDGKK